MKIACPCGSTLVDQTDGLPTKAHVIADQEWFRVLDTIDAAIERTKSTARARELACHRVRRLLSEITRLAWQCSTCGRLFLDDANRSLREFVPVPAREGGAIARDVFKREQRPEPE